MDDIQETLNLILKNQNEMLITQNKMQEDISFLKQEVVRLDKKIDTKFNELDDKLEKKIDTKFDELNNKVDENLQDIGAMFREVYEHIPV